MNSSAFWDKRAKQYDDAIGKHDPPFDKTIARTSALLSSSDAVIDLGCGSGEFSVELAPCVRKIHGIDTSEGMIKLAREKARNRNVDNATFEQCDLPDCGLQAGSFSSAIAFSIFHLVDDPAATLASLRALLESGGLLISETPCPGDRSWLFRTLLAVAQRMGLVPAIRNFSSAELESLVAENGFEILESETWDPKSATHWIVARKN